MKNQKKPYKKPVIQEVPLVVEEAVLAGCKNTANASSVNCNDGAANCKYHGAACSSNGS